MADWDKALTFDDGATGPALRFGRALTLAHSGDVAAAVADAERALTSPAVTGLHFADAAKVFALAAAAPGDSSQADKLATRAVAHLRRALAVGYNDVNTILNDPDLKAVRDRADFSNLLWDMADTAAQ